jgi:ABC-type Fe3+ transport system permease subunit/sugar lactone lactonase YvrE
MNWRLLGNSLAVSALTTLLACAFGFCAALCLAGLQPRAKKIALLTSIAALMLPPFLATNCWIHLLGATGIWREWLPLNIYSIAGVVWIVALMYWPITLLLVLGAWQKLERDYFEADPALRGVPLIRWLLLPAARPALAQGALMTFVLALNHFAVPAILQVKVFPAEIWLKLSTELNYAAAWAMSAPLIIVSLIALLFLWSRRAEISWPTRHGAASAETVRMQLAGIFYVCATVTLLIIFFSVILPLLQIALDAKTWRELHDVFSAISGTVGNSFMYAAAAATACILIAVWSWRWRAGWCAWLLFLAPGVLIATAMIYLFNRPLLDVIYHSITVVVIALTCRFAALNWQGVRQSLQRVDRDALDAVRLETASRWRIFWTAYWPQTAATFCALWYVTYLLCLWEVETLVMIYPPGGETLALRVFNLLHYGHIAQVNALCLLLLALAVLPLLLWGIFKRALVLLLVLFLVLGCNKEPTFQSAFFSRVEIIGRRGAGAGELNKPRSVAIDRDDNLYVVDMTGRVQKFSPRGEFLLLWQMPQTDKGKPKGMCRDREGNIVVLEPHYSRVNHFSPEGKLVSQWGTHGTNAGELAFPRSVALNSKGEIIVSEYGITERVQSFMVGRGVSSEPSLVRHFGKAGAGPGEFNRAEGLGTGTRDRIYVADSCNHRVQIFSTDGQHLTSYGRPGTAPGEMSYPYDVRVDAQGFQYVCEFGNSRIQIFDPQHRLVEVLGGPGAAPGKMSNPWAIALDSHGNLYVADAGNHRVLKFIRSRRHKEADAHLAPDPPPHVGGYKAQ